ncbi:hypothetical protein [Pandoraea communis]|uniref:hypothetical protein n=1 Tax=Pandoraea communis TaxID=2508297 RepID=UPI001581BDE9|nr:hypothetical protein [Pandoraea communis]
MKTPTEALAFAALPEQVPLGHYTLAFMSTVHGAMLTARVLGSADSFQAVSRVAIQRLSAGN